MQTDKIHELSEKLTTLHEVYSRRISDRALSLWMEKLSQYIGPELDRVLDEAMTQRTMPTLGDLIQTTQAAIRRANQPKAKGPEDWLAEDRARRAARLEAMTPEEREKELARERQSELDVERFWSEMRRILGY